VEKDFDPCEGAGLFILRMVLEAVRMSFAIAFWSLCLGVLRLGYACFLLLPVLRFAVILVYGSLKSLTIAAGCFFSGAMCEF